MPGKADIRAEALRLLAAFEAAGAETVEVDILQPAGTLLDLYGEDIRARAYITSDPLSGERMLRPDFTVPIVQAHLSGRHGAARYTYAGEVFRKQEDHPDRASEYLQTGFEIFGDGRPADDDAEVFAVFAGLLAPLGLRPAIGDIGLLRAAVEGLSTSRARKDALLRHLWRPRRFRTLLDRFRGRGPAPAGRAALLDLDDPFAGRGPAIGLRHRDEVEARLATLRADAETPPIRGAEAAMLDALVGLADTVPRALVRLRDMAGEMPALGPAVDGFAARAEALSSRGIDLDALAFEASFGRTTLEYYDGFVFGFLVPDRPDLPPVASGGRYDALTRALGGPNAPPAVGGVIRPGLTLALGGDR